MRGGLGASLRIALVLLAALVCVLLFGTPRMYQPSRQQLAHDLLGLFIAADGDGQIDITSESRLCTD